LKKKTLFKIKSLSNPCIDNTRGELSQASCSFLLNLGKLNNIYTKKKRDLFFNIRIFKWYSVFVWVFEYPNIRWQHYKLPTITVLYRLIRLLNLAWKWLFNSICCEHVALLSWQNTVCQFKLAPMREVKSLRWIGKMNCSGS